MTEVDTNEEIMEIQSDTPFEQPLPSETYHQRGILKIACKCGHVSNVTDEVIEDGLTWTMLIGDEHYIRLICPDCGSELKLYIEEIFDNDAISAT